MLRPMILVTGTKRSGTSMWMQILQSAGFSVIGSAFPKDWGDTIRDANPEGFYESHLRNGIHFQTNPHPKTGAFIHPADSRSLVVKVFVPGLVRTDLAYVDRVLGTMRNWREYHGSLMRLYTMERENRSRIREKEMPDLGYVPPALEWWAENYSLLSDVILRRLPIHMVAYESVLREPEATIREVLGWIGDGDEEAAIAAVKPPLRTHEVGSLPEVPDIEPEIAAVFDELYARVRDRRGVDGDFIDVLNDTNDRLAERIDAAMARVREHRMRLRQKQRAEAAAQGAQAAAKSEDASAQEPMAAPMSHDGDS